VDAVGIVAELGAQVFLALMMVHRESLTFDEGNHMFDLRRHFTHSVRIVLGIEDGSGAEISAAIEAIFISFEPCICPIDSHPSFAHGDCAFGRFLTVLF
jgi:hypothetical protein